MTTKKEMTKKINDLECIERLRKEAEQLKFNFYKKREYLNEPKENEWQRK